MEIENKTLEDISSDPIKKFYDHLQTNLGNLFATFLANEAVENKTEPKKIEKVSGDIEKNKQLLKKSLDECNIGSSIFLFIIIIPTFFIIIGFVFLKPFNRYLANIKRYFSEKKKYKKIIQDLNEKIQHLNLVSLGTFNLMDFLNQYFKSKGIRKFDIINNDKIDDLFKKNIVFSPRKTLTENNGSVVDVKGVECRIRNNPFYDVLIRKLEAREVITSNSQSFPYQSIETQTDSNGKTSVRTVTRYEYLTAFHRELTPFIESKNIGIYETKFAPGLNFYTNSKRKNDIINLENEAFSKAYKLNGATNRVELNSFFTIKAQEDYLSWFLLQNKYNPFYKIGNYIYIEIDNINKSFSIKNNAFINKIISNAKPANPNNLFLESLVVPRKSISDFLTFDKKVKKSTSIKNGLNDAILNYINKFSSAAILPLLSPAISREAFRDNNDNYLISQSLDSTTYNNEIEPNSQNNSKIKITSKLCDAAFFSFLNKRQKKPMWIEIAKQHKMSESMSLIKLNLNSFWSETKIDLVSVFGVHVGHKIIPVTYEEFHPMSEEKEIIYFAKPTNMTSKILISRIDQVQETYLTEESENKYLLDNNIWTNNPKDLLENNELMARFKVLVSRFYEISSSLSTDTKKTFKINNEPNFKGFSSLLIDKDGIYFIHNWNINKELVPNIKQLLTDLGKLIFI